MDQMQKTRRDVQNEVKEDVRDLDGHDLGDDIGNAGDRVREGLGNTGDDLRRTIDDPDTRDYDVERERETPRV